MVSGFFGVLKDITTLIDDVAALSKLAAKKTAGILGDDLAVNAEKSAKFDDHRELPVLFKITMGAFLNKLILLPIIFLLSYFLPQAIIFILILGGIYLSYEGFEKIEEYIHSKLHPTVEINLEENNDFIDLDEKSLENKKVKSAIFTDFILSIEIVIIALSAVLTQPIQTQIIVVSFVSFLAVICVYGLVGLLIRLDNIGFWIQDKTKEESFIYKFGGFLISALPILINILSVVGTIAMLLVAGGIFNHNISFLHHLYETFNYGILNDLFIGLLVGFITVFCLKLGSFFKHLLLKK